MKKTITTIAFSIILTVSLCQAQRKVTTYLLLQYNQTIHDRTLGNNPWGIGPGLQAFFNNKTKFKAVIELSGIIYLEDDKVLRLNADGTIPTPSNDVRGMVNLFFGSSFHPARNFYLSLVAGPAFTGGRTLPGIKPSFGFYLGHHQRCTGTLSYINVFNRDRETREDFGSLALDIGFKLF